MDRYKTASANCDMCNNLVFDEESECYICMANLDEDDMYRFLSGINYSCPFYRSNDDYEIVRKQI